MPSLIAQFRQLDRASLLVARGFFFFGQRLVPNVLAKTQRRVKRFGFAFADLAAFVQVFLNKCFVSGVFGYMFHKHFLTVQKARGNVTFGMLMHIKDVISLLE